MCTPAKKYQLSGGKWSNRYLCMVAVVILNNSSKRFGAYIAHTLTRASDAPPSRQAQKAPFSVVRKGLSGGSRRPLCSPLSCSRTPLGSEGLEFACLANALSSDKPKKPIEIHLEPAPELPGNAKDPPGNPRESSEDPRIHQEISRTCQETQGPALRRHGPTRRPIIHTD